MPGAISIVIAVMIIGALKISRKEPKLTSKSVIAIFIGSLIYAIFSNVSIPIGPNTSFRIAITFLTVFGALYGPTVGFLVGFIGHAINDALTWGSVWWSWVYLSAVIGLFSGLVKIDKTFDPLNGKFERKHFLILYMYSATSIIVASVIAYAGDVILYNEPAEKVWLQIILASTSNFGVIIALGIPSVFALAVMNKSKKHL